MRRTIDKHTIERHFTTQWKQQMRYGYDLGE